MKSKYHTELEIAYLQKRIIDLETICAESYQVVGYLSDKLGSFNSIEVIKVLDNLSSAELIHSDILPFSIKG